MCSVELQFVLKQWVPHEGTCLGNWKYSVIDWKYPALALPWVSPYFDYPTPDLLATAESHCLLQNFQRTMHSFPIFLFGEIKTQTRTCLLRFFFCRRQVPVYWTSIQLYKIQNRGSYSIRGTITNIMMMDITKTRDMTVMHVLVAVARCNFDMHAWCHACTCGGC